MIQFFVAMTPVGKARARVTSRGTFTPEKTVQAERLIAWECKKAMSGRKPLDGAVYLAVEARFPYPKSWSEKRAIETYWHVAKPDADNLLKVVGDALNKIAWRDDAQVVEVHVRKRYTHDKRETGLRIDIGHVQ